MAVDVTPLTVDEVLERNWRRVFKSIALSGSEVLAVKYYDGKVFGYMHGPAIRPEFSSAVANLVPFKPMPTYREWTYDEIPVGQPVCRKAGTSATVGIILHKLSNGYEYDEPVVEIAGIGGTWTPRGLLDEFEIIQIVGSHVNKRPCGVMQEAITDES